MNIQSSILESAPPCPFATQICTFEITAMDTKCCNLMIPLVYRTMISDRGTRCHEKVMPTTRSHFCISDGMIVFLCRLKPLGFLGNLKWNRNFSDYHEICVFDLCSLVVLDAVEIVFLDDLPLKNEILGSQSAGIKAAKAAKNRIMDLGYR